MYLYFILSLIILVKKIDGNHRVISKWQANNNQDILKYLDPLKSVVGKSNDKDLETAGTDAKKVGDSTTVASIGKLSDKSSLDDTPVSKKDLMQALDGFEKNLKLVLKDSDKECSDHVDNKKIDGFLQIIKKGISIDRSIPNQRDPNLHWVRVKMPKDKNKKF